MKPEWRSFTSRRTVDGLWQNFFTCYSTSSILIGFVSRSSQFALLRDADFLIDTSCEVAPLLSERIRVCRVGFLELAGEVCTFFMYRQRPLPQKLEPHHRDGGANSRKHKFFRSCAQLTREFDVSIKKHIDRPLFSDDVRSSGQKCRRPDGIPYMELFFCHGCGWYGKPISAPISAVLLKWKTQVVERDFLKVFYQLIKGGMKNLSNSF